MAYKNILQIVLIIDISEQLVEVSNHYLDKLSADTECNDILEQSEFFELMKHIYDNHIRREYIFICRFLMIEVMHD